MKPANPDGIGPRRRVVKPTNPPAAQPPEDQPEPPVEPASDEQAPKKFWTRRKIKWIVYILIFAGLLTVGLTNLRYAVLNLFLSGRAHVAVVDTNSGQPIPGATVTIGNVSATTDHNGNASLTDLKLGQQKLVAAKPGYQSYTDTVTVFLGHNQFGPAKLLAVGIPLTFKAIDSIGQQPLSGVTVTAGDVSGQTGSDGSVIINVTPSNQGSVTFTAPGFTSQTVTAKLQPKAPVLAVKLVPSAKHYFLSNRSGTIDLYQSNADGSNQSVLLAGTGKENSSTSLLVSGDGQWLALLSSREGVRDNQGNLQNYLYVFDPNTKNLVTADRSPNLSLIGWVGDVVVYTSGVAGSSDQTRLWSFNPRTHQEFQLANSTFVSSALIHGNTVFYTLNDSSNPPVGVYAVSADGSNRRSVYNQPASLTRSSKTTITVDSYTDNRWLTYDFVVNKLTQLPGQPPQLEDRYLQMSDSGNFGAVVLTRDGQSNLYLTDSNGQNEKQISTVGSVRFIERWLDDTYVIFRVENSDQTADYIVNVDGGPAVKITDVYSGGSYYGY